MRRGVRQVGQRQVWFVVGMAAVGEIFAPAGAGGVAGEWGAALGAGGLHGWCGDGDRWWEKGSGG